MLPVMTGDAPPPKKTNYSVNFPLLVTFIEYGQDFQIIRLITKSYEDGEEPPAIKANIERNEERLRLDKFNSVEWARK